MSPHTAICASILLALSGATACSTSSSNAQPDATAGDAGVDDDATSDGPIVGDGAGGTVCGPPPYVTVQLIARGIQITPDAGDGPPIAGVTLTASACPGVAVATGADGTITAQISKGDPLFAHFAAPNYASIVISEMKFDTDRSGLSVTLPPSFFTSLIPGYAADKPAIVVGAMKNGADGGPCDALDGIQFAVDGHPEATIIYFDTSAVPQPSGGTVTTTHAPLICSND